MNFTVFCFSVGFNAVDGDLNQYKTVVPLFIAAYAAPNKGTQIYTKDLGQFPIQSAQILTACG